MKLTALKQQITWLYLNIAVEGVYLLSFILTVMSVSSKGISVLNTSKILRIIITAVILIVVKDGADAHDMPRDRGGLALQSYI